MAIDICSLGHIIEAQGMQIFSRAALSFARVQAKHLANSERNMTQLPKALRHEPLVDAVFEVRLRDTPPLADILPGFLLHDFGSDAKVTRLPAADIPYPLRRDDSNLQFAPIQRIDLGGFLILVGDQNIAVSCKLPYPKWPKFKPYILDVMHRVSKIGMPGEVERYSVKYVNLIEAPTYEEQIGKISMTIKLGHLDVCREHMALNVHRKEEGIVHILSISTGARTNMNEKEIYGVLVDIDSIKIGNFGNMLEFTKDFSDNLEFLRRANKEKFFSCLKPETIEEMGPDYE
ncbi:MAG: TIGR04255 family protein [Salinarimonas sp.]